MNIILIVISLVSVFLAVCESVYPIIFKEHAGVFSYFTGVIVGFFILLWSQKSK